MNNAKLTREQTVNQNPFVYNAPVRTVDFFNRDAIIDMLLKETVTGRSQGNVWITGERKVGPFPPWLLLSYPAHPPLRKPVHVWIFFGFQLDLR